MVDLKNDDALVDALMAALKPTTDMIGPFCEIHGREHVGNDDEDSMEFCVECAADSDGGGELGHLALDSLVYDLLDIVEKNLAARKGTSDPLRDATEEEIVQAILDAASHGEGASETNVINAFLANRRGQGGSNVD